MTSKEDISLHSSFTLWRAGTRMPSGSRVREPTRVDGVGSTSRVPRFLREHERARCAEPSLSQARKGEVKAGGKKPTVESVRGKPWRGTRP